MVGLPGGEKTKRICVIVSTQYRHVTDRQMDRQTSCHSIVHTIIIIKNECHSNIIVDRLKVAATAKSCGKAKVSEVKSFDRCGVSCKNARTV